MVKCPVCLQYVNEQNKLVGEHKRGTELCYGSYMPVTQDMRVNPPSQWDWMSCQSRGNLPDIIGLFGLGQNN